MSRRRTTFRGRNSKAFVRARRLHADGLPCIVLHDMLWHWGRHGAKTLGTGLQGAPLPFTMDDFHDLIRLIETRPEWRAELRRLVLTEELLAAPDQLAALRARSEEQFQALVEAQQRTNIQLTTLNNHATLEIGRRQGHLVLGRVGCQGNLSQETVCRGQNRAVSHAAQRD